MTLIPMTQAEYDFWSPRSRAGFAEDKIKANGLTRAEAEKISADAFNRLLPDGLNSKDNFLFSAQDEEGNRVGFIWFGARGEGDSRRAFICDVIIEEPYRGRGFGRQMMLLAETEARARGLKRIGLHVFGFNEPAVRLYRSLGYLTTDLVMEKDLL